MSLICDLCKKAIETVRCFFSHSLQSWCQDPFFRTHRLIFDMNHFVPTAPSLAPCSGIGAPHGDVQVGFMDLEIDVSGPRFWECFKLFRTHWGAFGSESDTVERSDPARPFGYDHVDCVQSTALHTLGETYVFSATTLMQPRRTPGLAFGRVLVLIAIGFVCRQGAYGTRTTTPRMGL